MNAHDTTYTIEISELCDEPLGPPDITIRGTRHASAHAAIAHLSVSGDDRAINVGGMYLSVTQAEAERLEAAGIPFAYMFDYDGRFMTVPVNDD
ncbi:MAG: hypothetical protein JXA69_07660 [Phycisphaerae bacterium]|nr:hypothetical protein [Phycisphaerae bacterium]